VVGRVLFYFLPDCLPHHEQAITPITSRNLVGPEKDLQLLSFSIDPGNDRPHVLKQYRNFHKLPKENWDLLTGNETETHRLGIEHFMVFAGKDSLSAGGYAHSGAFTLVDAKGYVRGVYAVTNLDMTVNEQEYLRMVKELNMLYHEYLTTRKKTDL
jgi:protein SCO1/2